VTQTTSSIQRVIDELKNLTPDIATAVVFRCNGEVLASNKDTTAEQTQTLINSLKSINAQAIGGIATLTIQDVNSQLTLTAIDNTYLATDSSRMANQKAVTALTQVVIPTVIRLATKENSPAKTEPPKTTPPPTEVLPVAKQTPPTAQPPQPLLATPPTKQFMVEKIGGLLVASDVVRIDSEVVADWQSHYGSKQLTRVKVETLEGKAVTCKFKPQKDGKANIKGVIQIPEKLLQTLQSNRGMLVMVKPTAPEEFP
jgi:hypothetical protein